MYVFVVNGNAIELDEELSDTSYYLNGHHVNNFDYDFVFYDNINYFLQENDAWKKSFTSEAGALNDFDDKNFLQFLPDFFRSSIDVCGTITGD